MWTVTEAESDIVPEPSGQTLLVLPNPVLIKNENSNFVEKLQDAHKMFS